MSSKKRKSVESTQYIPSIKLLSCQRCRARKVKCNFEHPCSSCVKVGAECVQITNDMRKKRPPANYVSDLEKKASALSSLFEKFKNAEGVEQKQEILDQVNLEELLLRDYSELNAESSFINQDDTLDDRAVYGPTSVYDDNIISNSAKSVRSEESSIKVFNQDPDILQCIKIFFTWQYPDHNMFIFREAFLIDFFKPKPNSLYCSKALVLSICAMGSRMSDDEKIYSKSKSYYKEAKGILLSRLESSSITSLQSFLLLSFYDICNGFNSSGWMLSGNAIRMGYDLGFQLNPKVWFLKSKEDLSPLDVEIRSRIYWGCYMADHFISLLLGRPSLLKLSDASISESDDLPELEWIDDYRYTGPNSKSETYISDPLKKLINLINISDNILNDIFTKSDSESSNFNTEDLDLEPKLDSLREYNFQIKKWKDNLPDDLQWDKQTLKETAENPTMGCIRYYYYILILCLNRPFMGITKPHVEDDDLTPRELCFRAIDDLYEGIKRFRSIHGLRRASILIVYCSILSLSIILLTNTSRQLVNDKKEKLQFFLEVLHECSKTWQLAEKSYQLIKSKLKSRYEISYQDIRTSSSPLADTQKRESRLTPNHDKTIMENSHILNNGGTGDAFNNLNEQEYIPPISNIPAHEPTNYESNSKQSDEIYMEDFNPTNQDRSVVDSNTEILFDKNLEFFGGPPVLMTSDLFNEDWESLFPDYIFKQKN